jgi:hypothetical protein
LHIVFDQLFGQQKIAHISADYQKFVFEHDRSLPFQNNYGRFAKIDRAYAASLARWGLPDEACLAGLA